MIYLILVLKGFLLTWFILNFEPIQTYVVGFLEGLNKAFFTKKPLLHFILGHIIKVPTCSKCCGFWTGLIISSNIYVAIAVSILSLAWDKWNVNGGVKLW